MDILNFISANVILLPLIFGLFLLFCRIRLILLNKKVLNYGLFALNLLNFFLCSILTFFVYFKNSVVDFEHKIFDFLNIELIFGVCINKSNASILLFASLIYFLISIYFLKFFKTKKQFLFTKQRFYILSSLLISLTYSFIVSNNLLLSLVIDTMISTVLFVFAYFDIFKTNANYNIIRYLRINYISDFCFFAAFLLFFKYAVLSLDFIQTTAIKYSELNEFLSYMMGISSNAEYKLAILFLLIAVFARIVVFPFSCYYSFLANSSSVFYLPVAICINNFLGIMLYLNIIQMFAYFPKIKIVIYVFAGLTALYSIISLFFEKNVKIIFGYLIALINSLFIVSVLFFKDAVYIYFGLLIVLFLILYKLFSINKINFKRKLINKNKGFYLEKAHIVVFETLPLKTAKVFLFLEKHVLGLVFSIIYKITNTIVDILVIRHIKVTKINILKNIFFIFALFVILAIIIILFGGVDFG